MMILDFSMPYKNGVEVVMTVRSMIQILNEIESVKVIEPRFVILNTFTNPQFKLYLKS